METVHLIIKGKVQGVFYRASAKDVANELGIKGWVKNMPDGNVEILASGNKDQLEKFIDWCRQGPKRAAVKEIIITSRDDSSLPGFFIIK
jgi:acylphosphatase